MKIKLENKTIEVNKLPLGKYAELLKALDELPKKISSLDGLENEEILTKLPIIIADSLPEFIKIICIASPLTEDEVNSISLDEAVDVVLGIIKVNNYQGIFDKIKNLTAQKSVKVETK
mgnify:CR=1 FL=1|jgi:hypothetical protein